MARRDYVRVRCERWGAEARGGLPRRPGQTLDDTVRGSGEMTDDSLVIDRIIARLPCRVKQAVKLHYLANHSCAMIGGRMRISKARAWQLLDQAHDMVHENLFPQPPSQT